IGYSACHWCHVMERESFEDPRVAALMNEGFVCVKVDREERPDVDAIYMEAVQLMTGHGGWPLNVFLTPEQLPFYGGTYFPPDPRPGMPSWTQLLQAIAAAWSERREELLAGGEQLRERLSGGAQLLRSSGGAGDGGDGGAALSEAALDRAVTGLREMYDQRHGGFAGAPKFPQASVLEFLLLRGGDATAMALATLRAMAAGGIYDQLGGGFHRYSVDASWTVPHFEKMLYDNALLARAYLHGWQVSGEERFRRVCCETLDWALREMQGPEGGFCAALDADSEGVEGKFYVWTEAEIRDALGSDALADQALDFFRPQPFEHALILEGRGPEPPPADLAEIRSRLLDARSERVRPGLDDKRLTAWNALMITALAEAGAVLERSDYLEAAERCAVFVLRDLRDADGRLLRTWKDGRGRIEAYLEDHAFLVEALLGLYEATGEPRWFAEARGLADAMIERFSDGERGAFFTTASDHEPLAARRKDLEDSPIPSGNSAAAFGLLRLGLLAGEGSYERHALGVLRLLFGLAARHPQAFGHLLAAADFYVAPVKEVAIVGPDPSAAELRRVVRSAYRPHLVLAAGAPDGVPLLHGREPVDGRAAAYVCEHFVCQAPVTSPAELAAAL
ncbi:MAG TPA: thioredoxin domain-containing protein, partial [Solirubrobacteraceae bacterium]|nr:thioredoxin domain-containing protein [Solirubrobacteraceae bacterium]